MSCLFLLFCLVLQALLFSLLLLLLLPGTYFFSFSLLSLTLFFRFLSLTSIHSLIHHSLRSFFFQRWRLRQKPFSLSLFLLSQPLTHSILRLIPDSQLCIYWLSCGGRRLGFILHLFFLFHSIPFLLSDCLVSIFSQMIPLQRRQVPRLLFFHENVVMSMSILLHKFFSQMSRQS